MKGNIGVKVILVLTLMMPLFISCKNRTSIITLKKKSIAELKNELRSLEIDSKGKIIHHCVFSYIDRCVIWIYSIWSLRYQKNETTVRLATIEVSNNNIIQVRKKTNQLPGKLENTIIAEWAESSGLKMKYLH